jgi:hypothetical protein
MSLLHLPLSLTLQGSLSRATTEENTIGSRLRLFITSGVGEYLKLPSPGIRALWIQLYTMGISSRLCNVMEEQKRMELERIIKSEVNAWLDGIAIIMEVKLLGDEHEKNGVSFTTDSREFKFVFQYIPPGQGTHFGNVGPWKIIESSHETD